MSDPDDVRLACSRQDVLEALLLGVKVVATLAGRNRKAEIKPVLACEPRPQTRLVARIRLHDRDR
jgi:hypothetical protein